MANHPSPLERILHWLRAGYPEGVPQHDYVALLGVLQRHLTDQEVEELARQLRASRGAVVDDDQIRKSIRELALEDPSEEDVRRVAGRLAQGGWPLESPAAQPAPSGQEVE
ncbi:MAG: DUF3349 domain-containing protein [Micropruina sp.]|nr:DUF3349 domain-containing protein [Micropruina sp.]